MARSGAFFVILALSLSAQLAASDTERLLQITTALVKGFNLHSVTLVCDQASLSDYKSIRQFFLNTTLASKISFYRDGDGIDLSGHNVVFCARDENRDYWLEHERSKRGRDVSWFAVGNRTAVNGFIAASSIAVDQRVFFVAEDSGFVYESYDAGGSKVKTVIGYIFYEKDGRPYYRETSGLESFLERRSNLRGQTLRAVTKAQIPYIHIPRQDELRASEEGWETIAGGREFRDVSNDVGGLFFDVLKILERNLNFTTEIMLSKESDSVTFGEPVNGTWNGVIGNAIRREFDFVVTSVTATDMRYEVVDYLHPIGTETAAFYIPRKNLERAEWLSFLYPLRVEVWTCLFLNSLVLLLALKLFELFYYGKSFWQGNIFVLMVETVGDLWMLGASYFGRKPIRESTNKEKAIRVLLVCAFLSGNIVFMSYRASLTAELSVRRHTMPFDSVDDLIESDYKISYMSSLGAYLTSFAKSDEGVEDPPLIRLYHDKIALQNGEGSFNSLKAALDDLLAAEEPTTLMSITEVMPFYLDYHCSIYEVMKTPQPNLLSYAFPKGSPYLEVMNYELLKILEQGTLKLLTEKYLDVNMDCREDDQDVSLSFIKLVSLFAILATGVLLSVALIACELYFKNRHNKNANFMFSTGYHPELEMTRSGAGAATQQGLDEPQYDDRLKRFMFRWGISKRAEFVADFEQLLRLKNGQQRGHTPLLVNGRYLNHAKATIQSTSNSRLSSAANVVNNSLSRQPHSQRFTYRANISSAR